MDSSLYIGFLRLFLLHQKLRILMRRHASLGNLKQDIEKVGIAWATNLKRISFPAAEKLLDPTLDAFPNAISEIFERCVPPNSNITGNLKYNFYFSSNILWAALAKMNR